VSLVFLSHNFSNSIENLDLNPLCSLSFAHFSPAKHFTLSKFSQDILRIHYTINCVERMGIIYYCYGASASHVHTHTSISPKNRVRAHGRRLLSEFPVNGLCLHTPVSTLAQINHSSVFGDGFLRRPWSPTRPLSSPVPAAAGVNLHPNRNFLFNEQSAYVVSCTTLCACTPVLGQVIVESIHIIVHWAPG